MHAVENGAKGKARPKRSKSPQGGRFTPDPEPAPVVIRSTADLGAWLELLWVYARDAAAQRVQQAKATQGKIASANPNMAELRKRMAAVPRTRLKDAPTVRLALEAAGWVSPWTERVTEARIREVLRSRMARKEECLATDVSDLIEAQHGACRS